MGITITACKTTMGVFVIMIIVCVCINYYLIYSNQVNSDKKNLFIDSVYFTTTTLSSVGYGDLLPTTPIAKMLVALQQLIVLLGSWGMIALVCGRDNTYIKLE